MEMRPQQATASVVAKTSAASTAGMAARTLVGEGTIQTCVSQLPAGISRG